MIEWDLRLGDCIEGMRTLDSGSVDVTITDPPYEAAAHTQGRRVKRRGTVTDEPLAFAPITEGQRSASAFEIARVTRRWVLVFCQVEASSLWAACLVDAGIQYVRTMIWVKPDAQPQLTGDRPGMGYESIVVAHRPGLKHWNGGGRSGVLIHNKSAGRTHGEKAPHPTTKPLPLMRELVDLFSDPGELVMDPFSGSGSTGVACVAREPSQRRRFVGWELNAEYHSIAESRMRGESSRRDGQIDMFSAVRS